jgi:hypothetical protein
MYVDIEYPGYQNKTSPDDVTYCFCSGTNFDLVGMFNLIDAQHNDNTHDNLNDKHHNWITAQRFWPGGASRLSGFIICSQNLLLHRS